MRLSLDLALLFYGAGGADVLMPSILHYTALCCTDTNTAAMEPLLATVTADHEPRSSEQRVVIKK